MTGNGGRIAVRPARNHVIVRRLEDETVDRKTGLLYPKDFRNHVMRCVVTDVGDGNHDCTMEIHEGDVAILPKKGLLRIDTEGGEHHLCNVADIIGIE